MFENRQQFFNSLCLESGVWEQIPRCIKPQLTTVPTTKKTIKPTIRPTFRTTATKTTRSTVKPATKSSTITIIRSTPRPIQPRTCSLFNIPNKQQLNNSKLVLLDLHCTRSVSESQRCLPKQSYIKYTCERGFVFENQKSEFNSLCLNSGIWERIPRCVPGNYLFM